MANTAIVLGDSLYNTYGLIRSLGEGGIDFYFLCLTGTDWDPIQRSKYIKKGRFIRFRTMDELPSLFERLKNLPDKKFIICSSDPMAAWVDKHEKELSNNFITPCRGKQIGILFNKKEQCELATTCGIDVPESAIYTKGDNLNLNNISYPVFIKPLVSSEGNKGDIHICRNTDELCRAFNESKVTTSFIVQEYIENGYDVNCIGFRTDKQIIVACALRKYRLYPEKYGAATYMQIEDLERFNINVDGIKKFVETTGYYGPFSAEFMHTDSKNYFMEVNFRNDGLSYAVTRSGVNLYTPYINETILESDKPKPVVLMNIALDRGLRHSTHNMSLVQWLKQFAKADGYLDFSFKDPMPVLWRPIGFILRKLKIKQA